MLLFSLIAPMQTQRHADAANDVSDAVSDQAWYVGGAFHMFPINPLGSMGTTGS